MEAARRGLQADWMQWAIDTRESLFAPEGMHLYEGEEIAVETVDIATVPNHLSLTDLLHRSLSY